MARFNSNVELTAKQLTDFIPTYLSVIRKYCSVLPISRRALFPDFWNNHYQILAILCEDGVAIEFKRKIGKRKDSIAVIKRKKLDDVYPQLIGSNPRFPAKGSEGIIVENLAIATQSCIPFLQSGGTLLTIPDDGGFLNATAGGDIRLQNVGFFYVDKKGVPKQFTFKCLWILANDSPILLNLEVAQRRGLNDFLRQLLSVEPILGEKMKRYSEHDLLSEFKTIKTEYITLLNSENIAEQEMQDFLEKHGFVLSPLYLNICPKTITIRPQMQIETIDRKVDFVLLKEPTLKNYGIKCSIIEIKKPDDKLFTKKGEPSDQLKVGLTQINDIFEFIRSNPEEAKKLLDIKDATEIVGIVLIGRRKELTGEETKLLIELSGKNASQKILLYDDLLENIRFVAKVLGKKIRQPVVVIGQKGDSTEDFTGKSSDVIQEAINYLSERMKGAI
ncbi:DUF4263 domain-containing protein [Candidatus Bathyarchaeota archaeon]|nr:DUF4263 domain-containing protein [Candidatus Bathyarchaeota archaeon]